MTRGHPIVSALAGLALLFLLGPILVVVAVGFSASDVITFPPPRWSVRWFGHALTYEPFLSALGTSTMVALLATALALLVGVPAALAIWRGRLPFRRSVETLFLSPLLVPELVLGFALFQQLTVTLRMTAFGTLLVGHTVLLVPYAVRVTGAALASADPALEDAARGLGAGPLRAFLRVTLPTISPGIVSAAMLSLLTSFNNVPLSLLLAGPGTTTLPVQMLRYVEYSFDPAVAAVSVLLLVAAVVVTLVTESLGGLTRVFLRQEVPG